MDRRKADRRTDVYTDGQIPPVFYRTLSPSGPLPCSPLNFNHTLLKQGTGTADHLLPLGCYYTLFWPLCWLCHLPIFRLYCAHCVGSFVCPFSPFIVAIVLALSFARSHALLWPLCWFCCFQVFTLYCGHCVGSVVYSFFIIAIHLALLLWICFQLRHLNSFAHFHSLQCLRLLLGPTVK